MNEQTIEDWIGDGYFRVDHEFYRKRKRPFWEAMRGVSLNGTIMLEWERTFGTALEFIQPFLRLNGDAVDTISCPGPTGCGCAHRVFETRHGEIVLCCTCEEDSGCDEYLIQREDTLCHGVDWRAWDDAVRRALGFGPPSASPHVSRALREIGSFDGLAPVYVSFESEGALLRELIRIQGLRDGPFMVLTATGSIWGEQIEMLTRPRGVGHISLSSVLEPAGREFKVIRPVEPMLAEFKRRITAASGGVQKIVERIEGNLQTIARNSAELKRENVELRSAKQRLQKMLAEGMFEFTKKVDATSFKVFCAILAEGDVAKASRTLGASEDSIRSLVRRWNGRGKEYETMAEIVRWWKKSGGHEKVRLNDAILHERAVSVDYPGLLSDVLDGLLSMSEENWDERCQELADLLRPAVREAGR